MTSTLASEFALDDFLNATEVFVHKLEAHRASLKEVDAAIAEQREGAGRCEARTR